MRTEKIGREEAVRKARQRRDVPPVPGGYRIFHVHKSSAIYTQDPVTQAPLKQPKEVPLYTISFGWNAGNYFYSVFIPESGNAILSRYWTNEDSSWVSLRFGKCRTLQ
jgi:hypothetical protein